MKIQIEDHGRGNLYYLKDDMHKHTVLNHHKYTVDRNINIKGTKNEGSKGNEECVIENWRKMTYCYIVEESFAESCSTAMWNAELVNSKL